MTTPQVVLPALFILVQLSALETHACSCIPQTRENFFFHSQAVFLGSAEEIKIKENEGSVRYTFNVQEVFKAAPFLSGNEIEFEAGGPCGIGFELGKAYFVFVNDLGETGPITTLCSGNIAAEESPNMADTLRIVSQNPMSIHPRKGPGGSFKGWHPFWNRDLKGRVKEIP